jgi:hypothetical protein
MVRYGKNIDFRYFYLACAVTYPTEYLVDQFLLNHGDLSVV